MCRPAAKQLVSDIADVSQLRQQHGGLQGAVQPQQQHAFGPVQPRAPAAGGTPRQQQLQQLQAEAEAPRHSFSDWLVGPRGGAAGASLALWLPLCCLSLSLSLRTHALYCDTPSQFCLHSSSERILPWQHAMQTWGVSES